MDMVSLQTLIIGMLIFNGIPKIYLMRNLCLNLRTTFFCFYVDKNDLSGTIPPEIAGLPALETMILGELMNGNMKFSASHFHLILFFMTGNNQFTGTIPSQICDPPELDLVWLSKSWIFHIFQ